MLLGRRSIWKFYNLQLSTFSFEFLKKLQEILGTGLQLARLVEARHATQLSTSWISTKSTHWINIYFKPHANARNNVGSYILRSFAHPVACCWVFLFCDYRSVAQQSWICLDSIWGIPFRILTPKTIDNETIGASGGKCSIFWSIRKYIMIAANIQMKICLWI